MIYVSYTYGTQIICSKIYNEFVSRSIQYDTFFIQYLDILFILKFKHTVFSDVCKKKKLQNEKLLTTSLMMSLSNVGSYVFTYNTRFNLNIHFFDGQYRMFLPVRQFIRSLEGKDITIFTDLTPSSPVPSFPCIIFSQRLLFGRTPQQVTPHSLSPTKEK